MLKKKFKEAAEAYEILQDPQKRAQYDQFGHAGISDKVALVVVIWISMWKISLAGLGIFLEVGFW